MPNPLSRRTLVIGLCLGVASVVIAEAPRLDDYIKEITAARAEREARLQTPDGWLSLIGLHFLKDGANSVGSAKDNDVVLAKGPAHFGVATVTDGKVTFAITSNVESTIDGTTVREGELRVGTDKTKPTLVQAGTVSFFVIDRGGKKALRVKDSAAERRTHFLGLDYFPIDAAWRIEARWEPFESSRLVPITNILGQTSPAPVPGRAIFERDGKTYELWPIDEGPDEPLFFVISDATSGKETYAAARFVYAERPKDHTIVLDFNRAENPPCAFTPFATCPLPPKQNRLPFAIPAGEKKYRGAHE
jgi:uncharacterized protein (DUF1684 family)